MIYRELFGGSILDARIWSFGEGFIKKVAVWTRILGLPVEYINTINFIDDGVKVERGKFTRICIKVGLRQKTIV